MFKANLEHISKLMPTLALASALSLPNSVQASPIDSLSTITVNCGTGGTGVQAAVNASRAGDTIRVAGTCRETVAIINKKINLVGNPGAKIEAPSTPWSYAPLTSFHPVIFVANSIVNISNFTVDGRTLADSGSYSALTGIYFLNSDGSLSDSRILNFRRAVRANDWNVLPIRVVNTSIGDSSLIIKARKVLIQRNTIDNFEADGMFANTNDSAGNIAPLSISIKSNRIIGAGVMVPSQNGIQIMGFSSGLYSPVTGDVSNNVIDNIVSNSGAWWSSGIIAAPYYGPSSVIIRNTTSISYSNNQVSSSNIGLAIYSENKTNINGNVIRNGDLGLEASGHLLTVRGNQFITLDYGILSESTNLLPTEVMKNNKFYNVTTPFTEVGPLAFPVRMFVGASGVTF